MDGVAYAVLLAFLRITNKHTENMKTIVIKWIKEEEFGYGKAMRVIESDHPRFVPGYRFDYGFFCIATDEGYTIISLPLSEENT